MNNNLHWDIPAKEGLTFSLYPLPQTDRLLLIVSTESPELCKVHAQNAQGVLVLQAGLDHKGITQLNLSHLPEGAYHLVISTPYQETKTTLYRRAKAAAMTNIEFMSA